MVGFLLFAVDWLVAGPLIGSIDDPQSVLPGFDDFYIFLSRVNDVTLCRHCQALQVVLITTPSKIAILHKATCGAEHKIEIMYLFVALLILLPKASIFPAAQQSSGDSQQRRASASAPRGNVTTDGLYCSRFEWNS